MEILSVESSKRLDNYMINDIGLPSIILMENYAEKIVEKILHRGNKFLVFCGVGNNGGDGLVIARKLILAQKNVKVYIIGNMEKGTEEFNVNYNVLTNLEANIEIISSLDTIGLVKQEIKDADIVVDSIFGIGLNRKIEGDFYKVIDCINKFSNYTVSVDNPSGLDCNNGNVLNIAVRAKETFSIETLKKGYFTRGVKEYLGDVTVISIGILNNIGEIFTEKIKLLNDEEYRRMVPIRNLYGHKGTYGKVLILAGSDGFTGAAYLTTQAAIKTGAGLVTLLVPKKIQSVMQNKLIEAMTVNYDEEDRINKLIKESDVIICGPGIGISNESINMLKMILTKSKCKIVLDADALNIVSKNLDLIDFIKNRAIFTPHVGEMSRLTNKSIDYIESNRIDECIKYSRKNEIITVLKGYNTVISNGYKTVINNTGSSKMASGGMGDSLTGIIGSLVAQKVNIFDSATLGCYLHGFSGDILGKELYAVSSTDIIEQIPKTMEYIIRK